MYSNVDCLTNKINELRSLAVNMKPKIICLTEILPKYSTNITFLKNNLQEIFKINGYSLYNNKNLMRGTALYILNDLTAYDLSYDDKSNIESIYKIINLNDKKTLVGVIYRSPNANKQKSINEVVEQLNSIDYSHFEQVLIAGDFNLPLIKWNHVVNNECEKIFMDGINDLGLTNLVTEPSRYVPNQTPNVLDLVLALHSNNINTIEYISPIGKSDHKTILIYTNDKPAKYSENLRRNYQKADFPKMKTEIAITDWSKLDSMDCENSWKFFSKTLMSTIDKSVPYFKQKTHNFNLPLMSQEIKKAIKAKNNAYKRYIKSRCTFTYNQYKTSRNNVKYKIRSNIKTRERQVAANCKRNPKIFYAHVKEKLKLNNELPHLLKEDKCFTENDEEKAQVLNSFFASVFTTDLDNNINIQSNIVQPINEPMSDIKLNEEVIYKKLLTLNINKAMGPDDFPPIILQKLAKELTKPLLVIYTKSLEEGYLPSIWRTAIVTPIFKKGNKHEPNNYRPVSLTCICCKILESLIRDHIVNFVERNRLLNKNQFGFRKGYSCVTQLLNVMNEITNMIENKHNIDIIYFDFKKAFDTVSHSKLMYKCKAFGINNQLQSWIKAFLSNRLQRVKINNSLSSPKPVTSGIPQGSLLGPILFLIFINDLPNKIQSNIKLFADDTKIFNITDNSKMLQEDIDTLLDWSKTWDLHFNIEKCKVLHIGLNNHKNSYYMNNTVISVTTQEKDIGVTFDPLLNFGNHIVKIVSEANRVVGLIKHCFCHLDVESLRLLIQSLVRSKLEYANVIWSPRWKYQSIEIEKVQRRATKLIPATKNLLYEERLKILNLPTLKYRRLRGDLIQTYKIMRGIDNLNPENFFQLKESCTRNNTDKIYKPYCKTSIKQHFYTQRTINYWNQLKPATKKAETLNHFKKMVDLDLFHLKYNYD